MPIPRADLPAFPSPRGPALGVTRREWVATQLLAALLVNGPRDQQVHMASVALQHADKLIRLMELQASEQGLTPTDPDDDDEEIDLDAAGEGEPD